MYGIVPSWKYDSQSAQQEIPLHFLEPRRFIAVFTNAQIWSVSWTKLIKCTPAIPHTVSSEIRLLWIHLCLNISTDLNLFMYDLFNDAVSSSGYMALNDRMISEKWGGSKAYGSSRGLILVPAIIAFAHRNWGKTKTSPSGLSVFWQRFETGTSRILSRNGVLCDPIWNNNDNHNGQYCHVFVFCRD
jgi:hypothetical protein